MSLSDSSDTPLDGSSSSRTDEKCGWEKIKGAASGKTIKSLAVIHASTLYWVGAWDILALPFYSADGLPDRNRTTHTAFTFAYLALGVALAAASGTLYIVGGIGNGLHRPRIRSRPLLLAAALAGSMLLWVSTFGIVAVYIGPDRCFALLRRGAAADSNAHVQPKHCSRCRPPTA